MKKAIIGTFIVLLGSIALVSSSAVSKDIALPNLPQESELIKEEFRLPVEIKEVDKLGSEKIHYENGENIAKYEKITSTEDKRIQSALEMKLSKTQSLKNDNYHPLKIQEIRRKGTIAYLVLTSYPKVQTDPEILAPRILIAVAKKTKNTWNLYLEGVDKEYYQGIVDLPEDVMKTSSKKHFIEHINPSKGALTTQTTEDVYIVPGLPWKAGNSWRYTQSAHGTNDGKDCCLDFGTPKDPLNHTYPGVGGRDNVKAADVGTRVHTSGTCVFYKVNNYSIIYQHLRPIDIGNAPTNVNIGDQIGKTTLRSGCGGKTGGHHVHFGIWDKAGASPYNIDGSIFNGWFLDEPTLNKGNKSISPSLSGGSAIYHQEGFEPCAPPSSGDWYILSNCYIGGFFDIPGNIKLSNNSTLTVSQDAQINVKFKTNNIIIKPGSRIILKSGGKIY